MAIINKEETVPQCLSILIIITYFGKGQPFSLLYFSFFLCYSLSLFVCVCVCVCVCAHFGSHLPYISVLFSPLLLEMAVRYYTLDINFPVDVDISKPIDFYYI